MLTFLLDDVGIPKNYATMNGAGVHTFTFLNASGKATFAKFHWISEQGEHSLETDAEAAEVVGRDFSHATHHMINSIAAGHFPSWRLMVQTMDPSTELSQSWGDPLDATKTWPESQFPLREVGRMTLNKNLDNHFLEGEQIAFSPGNVIPGISYSADKLLQGRVFSYADTQRYRVGTNYAQLPINAPRCPFMNRQYDGALNFMHRAGDTNYFPSRGHVARASQEHAPPPPALPREQLAGKQTRAPIKNENNFGQAGERWRSFNPARRQRFVERVAGTLNEPKVSKQLKATWLGYWTQCDRELGARISVLVQQGSL